MKLEIVYRTVKLDPFGLEPVEIWPDPTARLVYIDGVRVPKPLADIILLGLDVAT